MIEFTRISEIRGGKRVTEYQAKLKNENIIIHCYGQGRVAHWPPCHWYATASIKGSDDRKNIFEGVEGLWIDKGGCKTPTDAIDLVNKIYAERGDAIFEQA